MAISNTQYNAIIRKFEQKQIQNRDIMDARRKTVYRAIPEMEHIHNSISELSVAKAKKLLSGDENALTELKDELKSLIDRKSELLISAGFSPDYLEPVYVLYTQSNLKNIVAK